MIRGIYYYHLNDLSVYQNELDAQYYLTLAQAAEIMDISEEDLVRLTRMKNKKGEHAIMHRVVDGEYRYRLKDLNVYKRKCLSGKALRLPKIETDKQQEKKKIRQNYGKNIEKGMGYRTPTGKNAWGIGQLPVILAYMGHKSRIAAENSLPQRERTALLSQKRCVGI